MSDVLFGELDLRDITFFGQHWDSLIGLRLVAAQPERFPRVVTGNGGITTGERPPHSALPPWQNFPPTNEHLPVLRSAATRGHTMHTHALITPHTPPPPTHTPLTRPNRPP